MRGQTHCAIVHLATFRLVSKWMTSNPYMTSNFHPMAWATIPTSPIHLTLTPATKVIVRNISGMDYKHMMTSPTIFSIQRNGLFNVMCQCTLP